MARKTKGKKNKIEMERWERVAQAIYEIGAMDEFPENAPWDTLDDGDKMEAFAMADILISLADNLIAPAIVQGLRKYQQQQKQQEKRK